jgi:hypothetical protein
LQPQPVPGVQEVPGVQYRAFLPQAQQERAQQVEQSIWVALSTLFPELLQELLQALFRVELSDS